LGGLTHSWYQDGGMRLVVLRVLDFEPMIS
jgi:hypothetical protein